MTETAPFPWYPRAVLAGCMALSLAGNLMHAWHTYNGALFVWFAVAWAGIPPVAVPVLIELVGREARHWRNDRCVPMGGRAVGDADRDRVRDGASGR